MSLASVGSGQSRLAVTKRGSSESCYCTNQSPQISGMSSLSWGENSRKVTQTTSGRCFLLGSENTVKNDVRVLVVEGALWMRLSVQPGIQTKTTSSVCT